MIVAIEMSTVPFKTFKFATGQKRSQSFSSCVPLNLFTFAGDSVSVLVKFGGDLPENCDWGLVDFLLHNFILQAMFHRSGRY